MVMRAQYGRRFTAWQRVFGLMSYSVMAHDQSKTKRPMLRLWLDVERKARPVVSEIHIYQNAEGRSGIDPQPGRLPAEAKYRAPDEEVRGRVAAE